MDRIKTATEDLGQAIQEIGASMYGQQQPGAMGGQPGADGGSGLRRRRADDEDVIEGDFTEL